MPTGKAINTAATTKYGEESLAAQDLLHERTVIGAVFVVDLVHDCHPAQKRKPGNAWVIMMSTSENARSRRISVPTSVTRVPGTSMRINSHSSR